MEPAGPAPDAQRDAVEFIVGLARALHVHGTPAYRLEDAMALCARRFGIRGQFFCTPTAIIASFETTATPGIRFIRVQPGGMSLQKLVQVDEVLEDVLAARLSPAEGSARLAAVISAPQPYGALLIVPAYAVASGACTLFMGGGPNELLACSAIGLLVGVLAVAFGRSDRTARIFEPIAAMTASALVLLAASRLLPLSVDMATLGSLIVLLPGFTMTVAMRELATGHLISGTARLMGSALTFLSIAFGTALGTRIGALFPAPDTVIPVPFPQWTELLGIVLAPLAFGVLFQARARDFGWILAAGAFGFCGARLGSVALGPELGVSVGAVLLGMGANVYARFFGRPSSVPLVPGLLLLVPGSIGFRSLASMLGQDVVSGIEIAFRMAMVAISLVAGLLVANVAVHPRRPS